MPKEFLFTSESVAAGHPDKLADQVSDAVLDAVLNVDAQARVACETLVKTGLVLVAGEIRSNDKAKLLNLEEVVREVVRKVGYGDMETGLDADNCGVLFALGQQSSDIARGVDGKEKLGAGDQGLMFGYACRDTENLMPAPIEYAHRLLRRHAECRVLHLPWLGADAKSQVTLRYLDGQPRGIRAIVLSTQHHPDIELEELREVVLKEIIRPVLPPDWMDEQTRIYINPTGRFVKGGPLADCGLTGRKIIVDTYGGMARHGGGAFSGKDPTKVDRSAAYAARHAAKNVVAAGLAERCEIQLSYAIGVSEPTSVSVETFGTAYVAESLLEAAVRDCFDLTPAGIIRDLELRRPIYQKTAVFGHFGREEPAFTWERTNRVEDLRERCSPPGVRRISDDAQPPSSKAS